MHKKDRFPAIILPSIVAGSLALGLMVGLWVGRNHQGRVGSSGANNNKLSATISLIQKMYVDPVNMDSISEHLLPDLLAQLDPHSVYIPASQMEGANETLEGQFDGIGVVFNMATDTVVVLNVIPSGPSAKAKVLNGDRIIKINDSIVAGRKINQNDIVKKLRGPRGTTVKLGIQRYGIKDLLYITVTRGIIPIKSIDAGFMVTPDIGFIKLSTFSRNSYAEVAKTLARLRGEGMKRLIFDLRGNSGGFLDQAIEIANEFLPKGDMIVYTAGRNSKREEQHSDGLGKSQDIPLVVLIDEGSASSSEILAGALQDNDRGTIIGRRSFGKGLVQEQIPFRDGSAIRLTVARYFTPTGRSIQKPYTKGDMDDYRKDITNRYEHSEFFSVDSTHFSDSLKFTTPKGKVVYGGGGIMPDIFIPLDTMDVTRYYLEVSNRNILYRYTMDYTDRNRAKLDCIKTLAELNALLDRDKSLFDNFISYAASRGVAPNREQIEKSRRLLTAQLRAYIGRNTTLEDAAFYDNIYVVDPVITRAISELEKHK